MATVTIDLNKTDGKIKPMHAVNNGPAHRLFAKDQNLSNLGVYKAAGIPYARTHDASFYAVYGGEHTVDIGAVFPDFDKDPYDAASYDFPVTDEYLQVIDLAGTKIFYRLGSKIEHWCKKYGTLPPRDFNKWAVICEHIIRHYTKGWANGFYFDIEYWEIWNEPDLDSDDSPNKRTWGGTKLQYFELYNITAAHLKKCFPDLKIGGPALAHDFLWLEDFLKQLKAPLDFCSWHIYTRSPRNIINRINQVRSLLDKYGFTGTESILNEWNYVAGWTDEKWLNSLLIEKSMKGAAFIAGTFCIGQQNALDMLMYYDARPCGMNGMFNTDIPSICLKGYYPFYMFNTLYKLGNNVSADSDDDDIYAVAARNGGNASLMLTYFSDDEAQDMNVFVHIDGLTENSDLDYCLLDEKHDLCSIRKETAKKDTIEISDMKPNSVYLINIVLR